jgi:hypothetical protein
MILHHDEDGYASEVNSNTCQYHRQYPGKAYAGCTCSAGITTRRLSEDEIALRRLKLKLEQEDRLLADADAILRARRAKNAD